MPRRIEFGGYAVRDVPDTLCAGQVTPSIAVRPGEFRMTSAFPAEAGINVALANVTTQFNWVARCNASPN
jgi:hypothetical protein